MSLREEIIKCLTADEYYLKEPPFKPTIEEVADDILALILKKLPEKRIPERGLQIKPCDREKCGMCNRVKGFNEALSEVRSILESPPPDPTNEELSKLTLEDLT